MTAEEIARVIRLYDGPNPEAGAALTPSRPAWEMALQLALIERDLLKLIHIELFRSPGYEDIDQDVPPRLSEILRHEYERELFIRLHSETFEVCERCRWCKHDTGYGRVVASFDSEDAAEKFIEDRQRQPEATK